MTTRFQIGDHLVTPRGLSINGKPILQGRLNLYTHHGLYVGNEQVIHYAGNAVPGVQGPVEKVSLSDFLSGASCNVRDYASRRYSREESVTRAYDRLREDNYDLFSNNCEHFVRWCINGDHSSPQVEAGSGVASGTLTAVGAVTGIGAVAAFGAVPGLSGPGIMSGLAAVGGAVGGGAVVGITVLAAAPGALTTVALKKTLFKDNPALPREEQEARRVGVAASGAGAIGATLGSVGVISALGASAGLSGAGIASGLAAVGSMSGAGTALTALGVGGGAMAGGVAVAVAAPAVAAAAVGYGAYRVVRRLRRGAKQKTLARLEADNKQETLTRLDSDKT